MINPDPTALGLGSIQLGPWFAGGPVNLALPRASDLSVAVPGGRVWLPPANGTLTLLRPHMVRSDGTRVAHRALMPYRRVDGAPLVPDDEFDEALVAVFTLLPEVYVRLSQLYRKVAILGSGNGAFRPVPLRWLMSFSLPSGPDELLGHLLIDETLEATIEDVGLRWEAPTTGESETFLNGPQPMAWIRRTGARGEEKLLQLPTSGGRLACFDQFGLPIDPGAVAAAFEQLRIGPFGATADPSVTVDAGRSVHLVGLGDGALTADALGWVTLNDTSDTAPLRSFTGMLRAGFNAGAGRPDLRLTVSPTGTYQPSVELQPNALLSRDQIRISVVDVELELVGASRADPARPHQRRASTRVPVARSTASRTLLAHHEGGLERMYAVLADPNRAAVTWIASQLSGAVAPIAAPTDSFAPIATGLESVEVEPLLGGAGVEEGTWSPALQAVVKVGLATALAGAWVHVMPLDFDRTTGERVRMTGGAGIAVASSDHAEALAVVVLPFGPSVPSADDVVAFDIEIVTSSGRRLFASVARQRPPRPPAMMPSGVLAPVVLTSAGAAPVGGIYVCETGRPDLVAGCTAIVRHDDSFAAVDANQVGYAAYNQALAAALRRGDRVQLTAPAWRQEPRGDAIGQLCATGAEIRYRRRGAIAELLRSDGTLPGHACQENVLTHVRNQEAVAVMCTVAPLASNHQLLLSQYDRAYEPSAAMLHGTAVHLAGKPALSAQELCCHRWFAATPVLLTDAVVPVTPPPDGVDPGVMVGVLRTQAAHLEGELELNTAVAPDPAAYPFDAVPSASGSAYDQKRRWLQGVLALRDGDIPEAHSAAEQERFMRAADRRVLGAAFGHRELAPVVRRALERAQRFVYIETPLFTAGYGLVSDDDIDVVGSLRDRLEANPNLYVLICVPERSMHVYGPLARYRTVTQHRVMEDFLIGRTTPALGSVDPIEGPALADRIVYFSPLGAGRRAIDIASTTIVVDDVLAITGSTELSRRGLTFDSSVAVSVVDERLTDGRSLEILRFRNELIAQRLGELAAEIPYEGRLLTTLVRERLATSHDLRITTPKLAATGEGVDEEALRDFFDPDGRPRSDVAHGAWLLGFLNAIALEALTSDSEERRTCG